MQMFLRTLSALAALLPLSSCGAFQDTFSCEESRQCTSATGEGVCEASGFCSFSDSLCDSGRRFGEHSGASSQQCVPLSEADAGLPVDAASVDATPPDAALPCDPDFALSPQPLGTGQVNLAAYSNPVPFVFIGMEITGPGTVLLGELSITNTYTWSYPFTVSAPGLYEATFTRDMGVFQASCQFQVADTGATPSL